MRSRRQAGSHRPVSLVSAQADAATLASVIASDAEAAPNSFSLLRLSVPARLLLVAAAAALLWTGVLWALR